MKTRPILFSAPMVRALLDGTKTQTRRVAKVERIDTHPQMPNVQIATMQGNGSQYWMNSQKDHPHHIANACPYGQPSDRLWVRETFQPTFGDGVERCDTNWGTGAGFDINYPATTGRIEWIDGDDNITDRCKPAIHMPRWASRITLEITAVRVERLQDISETDALAEGIDQDTCAPVAVYRELWEQINGFASWDLNPWVWVIEFKRVTQ